MDALGERKMSYNRRRRRSRLRVSPLGYIVLSIIILVMLVGIYFIIWSIRGDKTGKTDETLTSSVIVTPTPSLPPVADTATPTLAPTEIPTSAPADTPIVSADTPKPDDTPQPDAKTPSPSQVKSAIDGKTTSRLNLRKGPGKTYDILGTYDNGTQLKVYALENEFYFVMVVKENKYGYMSAEYVEKSGLLPGEDPTPSPPVPEGVVSGTVTASEVALRSVPSTEANTPIASLVRGDAVYIHFRTDGFYYLEVVQSGKKGYAYSEYIKADDSVPKGTPAP